MITPLRFTAEDADRARDRLRQRSSARATRRKRIEAGRPTWGHCFYQAGWRFCGLTEKWLHIIECYPKWVPNLDNSTPLRAIVNCADNTCQEAAERA